MYNIFIFFLFYIISSMMIIGYGQLGKIFFFRNEKIFNEVGIIGLFGFLILYFISTLINFFSNINEFIIIFVFLFGLLFFVTSIIYKKFNKRSLTIFYSTLILFVSIGIIAEPNEDFFFYYQPYMNYISTTKIVFGVVNINSTLAFSTNSLYDIIIFFKIDRFIENGFSIPILIFYILYLSYLIEKLLNKFDIFYFVVLFMSVVSFTKLRDFGTMLPPQLLLILIFCLTYSLILKSDKNIIFTKILILLTLALILRFNSIIIAPLIILLLIKNYKFILQYINHKKKIIFFSALVFSLFLTKNIINSGCLVYPVSSLCMNGLSWSSNLEITEQKYNKLKSDSKGWPFYAKETFNIENKFVWQNLKKEGFYNYNIYSKSNPFFWGKYWLMDPNYKKILNLFLISFFVLLILGIKKNPSIYNYTISRADNIFLYFSIISITIIWFLLSPQMRYGGYFCFIIFFGLIISNLNQNFIKKNHIISFSLLIFIALSYVNYKNFNRIFEDFDNQKFNNFPWPNNHELIENLDFEAAIFNTYNYNKRIKTNKLTFDNGNQSILMCGNIDFPCIPDGKEVCLGEKYIFYSYDLFKKNKNNKKCYNFMNKNILY